MSIDAIVSGYNRSHEYFKKSIQKQRVIDLLKNNTKSTSLTLSSTATFRDFQTNSQTAITHATPIPPIKTTKTPPTFASPNSFAAELDFDVSSYVKVLS